MRAERIELHDGRRFVRFIYGEDVPDGWTANIHVVAMPCSCNHSPDQHYFGLGCLEGDCACPKGVA